MRITDSSHWTLPQIETFLGAVVVPIRVGCISNGMPLISSLWFRYADGRLWCATQNHSRVAQCVAASPGVGFEVAPDTMPYRGVRGQGHAKVLHENGEGAETLLLLIDRYHGTRDSDFARWLMRFSENEVAICIEPEWLTAWDFSERMKN